VTGRSREGTQSHSPLIAASRRRANVLRGYKDPVRKAYAGTKNLGYRCSVRYQGSITGGRKGIAYSEARWLTTLQKRRGVASGERRLSKSQKKTRCPAILKGKVVFCGKPPSVRKGVGLRASPSTREGRGSRKNSERGGEASENGPARNSLTDRGERDPSAPQKAKRHRVAEEEKESKEGCR